MYTTIDILDQVVYIYYCRFENHFCSFSIGENFQISAMSLEASEYVERSKGTAKLGLFVSAAASTVMVL
jgi:hypothetical protein